MMGIWQESLIMLYILWSRLRCRPSAVSVGCGTWSPPFSKLAEILFLAISRLFWIFTPPSCLVHRKSVIMYSSCVGSAMNMWLYIGIRAVFIKSALWRRSVGGVVASILLFIRLASVFLIVSSKVLSIVFPR